MAIGRISGPMLVPDLERQGQDLSIDGDLIYFDVTNRRVGINTLTPNVALDVVGTVNVTGNLFIANSTATLYQLPFEEPPSGGVLTAEGGGSKVTYWAPGSPESSIRRRRYETTISSLQGYGNVSLVLPLGISSIVYQVSVSRPVKVEVFGTPEKNEPNPYTFIATPDHLVDDGSVVLNDGSSFQSRQYSIFANMEEPPTPNVYVTVTSIDSFEAATPITLSLLYFPAVTDSRPGMEIVQTLPTAVYEGKLVFLATTNKLYVYANANWQAV
jgi:hypothetical protein